MSKKRKVIIIGAGVAGLATAIRLAAAGFDVTVFEKNDVAGGKISALSQNGFHFDGGPSLFTLPQELEQLFVDAGEDMKDYLQYERVPVSCKYFYDNGKVITAFADRDRFAGEMKEVVGEDPDSIRDYLAKSENLYQQVGEIFLNKSLHRKRTFFHSSILSALRHASPGNTFQTLHTLNTRKFSKPETIQLFDRYATYNGSNPYKAPGMLQLIAHVEHNDGVYYPKGGMISIAIAMQKLAEKKGVKFKYGTNVQRIIYTDAEIKGVVADHKNYLAEIVVSNADVYQTYHHLLRDERHAKKISKHERSSSALVFYWGMNTAFPSLQLHNIFFSKDYQAEFQHIFKLKQVYSDPTVYVNVTSKMEAGMAPAGKENWFVMINAPNNEGQDWESIKQECKHNVIKKLSKILGVNVEKHIEFEQVLDPQMIEEQTNAYKGALYGSASNAARSAFMRHPNFSSNISGLYFAGGTVHPGGGIPLCLKSAKLTANLILQTKQKKHYE